jgi:hypothetical protein
MNKKSGKNITVYLPQETAAKMDELKEVNWSQICKSAIESYIKARKSVNPAVGVKMAQMKQAEEADGYKFGCELASEVVSKLSYPELYRLRWREMSDEAAEWWYEEPSPILDWLEDTVDRAQSWTDEQFKRWKKKWDDAGAKKGSIEWVLHLAESKKGFRKTAQFFNGMIDGLRETLK